MNQNLNAALKYLNTYQYRERDQRVVERLSRC